MLAEITRLRAIVRTANGQLEPNFAPLSGFEFISSNPSLLATLNRALEEKDEDRG